MAATRLGCTLTYADYETLTASLDSSGRHMARCAAGNVGSYDAVLCRTMPTGSMEQIIFRLAVLQAVCATKVPVVNPPKTLETAIDKYATLALVASLGIAVPETIVVQSRKDAMKAFNFLGGDVVVKPIFGGEGHGVMRIRDAELAWTAFSTLQQLDSILYVQRFISPGGRDTRMLVLGDEIVGVRRTAEHDFRTNVAGGARCDAVDLSDAETKMARQIATVMGLRIGSIDVLENDQGPPLVLEVNGVPGWKGAQRCVPFNIAEKMIAAVVC
jgi:RimK family alpha-L-glutamate ligase